MLKTPDVLYYRTTREANGTYHKISLKEVRRFEVVTAAMEAKVIPPSPRIEVIYQGGGRIRAIFAHRHDTAVRLPGWAPGNAPETFLETAPQVPGLKSLYPELRQTLKIIAITRADQRS